MRLQVIVRRVLFAAAAVTAAGCKSDLNQQLLERELRYQEDQIYWLQDELQEKKSRLDHVATENASLRRQLGVSAADNPAPGRSGQPVAPRVAPATNVPPAIQVPDVSPLPPPRGGPPVDFTPPTLEGIPALPSEPVRPPNTRGISFPPGAADIDPTARAIGSVAEERSAVLVRIGHEDSAGGPPVRLVIKPLDDAAVGGSGIAFAVEPRDSNERLVSGPAGDFIVTAFDTALPPAAAPIARWTVPASEVAARFRPTGRNRGVSLALPWQGTLPAGDHVRLEVQATTASGHLAAESLLPIR